MNEHVKKRIALVRKLLLDLHNTVGHIGRITENMGDASEDMLKKVYEEHQEKIGDKVHAFNSNVSRVRDIHQEITRLFNSWHDFTRDAHELSRLSFPFKVRQKQHLYQKALKDLQEEITGILIRNRLLKEDIARLESDLAFEAAQRLKKDVRYEDYLTHLKRKSELIGELRYLLPTLPEVPVRVLDIHNLQDALDHLPAV